ncbi:MAG: hypothetical protein MUE40_04840 [Anaerolineae bacterium]|jgi:hypothetical protein|nr:hypothetical protein [Anaerolineae bacterium]
MDSLIDNNLLTGLAVYGGVVLVAFWLAMIIWSYRDMRARSRDALAQVFVAATVAVLNVPGLFIYILLRPRETLSEAYERSLEEEALLQEIEEKPSCPGCGGRVLLEWQVCPACHTRLKKPCQVCGYFMELSWTVCPRCASAQPAYQPQDEVVNSSRHVQRQPPPPEIPEKWLSPSVRRTSSQPAVTPPAPPYSGSAQPGFVDDDYTSYQR